MVLTLVGCSNMPESSPQGNWGAGIRVLEEFNLKGTDAKVSVFCRGADKWVWMDGTHKGSVQLAKEDSEDCK